MLESFRFGEAHLFDIFFQIIDGVGASLYDFIDFLAKLLSIGVDDGAGLAC